PHQHTSEENSLLKENAMGQIRIVNKHHGASAGVYVGRPTLFGNPYRVQRDARAQAVEQYRDWLRRQWPNDGQIKKALLELARTYTERDELTLICWCAPQRCHAEVIREAVLGIVQHGLVESQPTHDRQATVRMERHATAEHLTGRIQSTAPESHMQGTHGGTLKLIIAGSRQFTDYHRLCQVLDPDNAQV